MCVLFKPVFDRFSGIKKHVLVLKRKLCFQGIRSSQKNSHIHIENFAQSAIEWKKSVIFFI
jgi:hypothetical protein